LPGVLALAVAACAQTPSSDVGQVAGARRGWVERERAPTEFDVAGWIRRAQNSTSPT